MRVFDLRERIQRDMEETAIETQRRCLNALNPDPENPFPISPVSFETAKRLGLPPGPAYKFAHDCIRLGIVVEVASGGGGTVLRISGTDDLAERICRVIAEYEVEKASELRG